MSEPLNEEIRSLRQCFWSERDPEGRVFAPLADAYLRFGEVEEAEQLVREGLGRHPDFATGHLVAARVARASGEVAKMRKHADRAIELDAGNVLARIQRAAVYARDGDSSAALADLRNAASVTPGGVEAFARLAELEAVPEVGELIGTVVAENTGKAGGEGTSGDGSVSETGIAFLGGSFVTRTMGDLYASQGLLERAAEVYEHLVRSDPENAELVVRLDALRAPPPAAAPPRAPLEPDSPVADYFEELLAWEPGAPHVDDPATPAGAGRNPVRTVGSEAGASPEPTTPSGPPETAASRTSGVDEFTCWLEGLQS